MTISWPRLAWTMARHMCGPMRAFEIETARRYDRARLYHLPPDVRAAHFRRMIEESE